MEIPVLAKIPYDINVLRALSAMVPYTVHRENSKGSEEFMKLAAVLSGEKYRKNGFLDFFRNLNPSKQEVNREIFYKSAFK